MVKLSLIGRPNVGKSTLFNRLSNDIKAIVHNKAGVTRDRKYGCANLEGIDFTVIDTPGIGYESDVKLIKRIEQQTLIAIKESDIILFIVDGIKGIVNDDIILSNLVRNYSNKKIFLIVNKCEKKIFLDKYYFNLGFGSPILLSAAHGIGMSDLYDALKEVPHFKIDTEDTKYINTQDKNLDISNKQIRKSAHSHFKDNVINIAIVGRPNSGKSTFINSLIGQDLLLTGEEIGLTREDIAIPFTYNDYSIKIIDTAGVRRRSKITDDLEKLSVSSTVNTFRRAHVVVLLIDVSNWIENQDLNIANLALNKGVCLVIGINKIDLLGQKMNDVKKNIQNKVDNCLSQVKGVPIVYLSALNNNNVYSVIESCCMLYKMWSIKISTRNLNIWIKNASMYTLKKNGKNLKIKYCCQVANRPPTFKIFVNNTNLVTDSYKRYLVNSLRTYFNLKGLPILLKIASTSKPI